MTANLNKIRRIPRFEKGTLRPYTYLSHVSVSTAFIIDVQINLELNKEN